jgi:predicted Zn-dependent protease
MTAKLAPYQVEELTRAAQHIAKAWHSSGAADTTRTVLVDGKDAATFFGLAHDTDSVCAVIRYFNAAYRHLAYLHLVHYSRVQPVQMRLPGGAKTK